MQSTHAVFAKISLTATLLFYASAGAGAAYQLELGPYVGGGILSSGDKVRQATGFAVASDVLFPFTGGWRLGPRIRVSNGIVSSLKDDNLLHTSQTYDHRLLGAGAYVAKEVKDSWFSEWYIAPGIGRGFSKLQIDRSSSERFEQLHYQNLGGDYVTVDGGLHIPLGDGLGMQCALTHTAYRIAQRDATGTVSGDRKGEDGQVFPIQGSLSGDDTELDGKLVERTYGARVAFALRF